MSVCRTIRHAAIFVALSAFASGCLFLDTEQRPASQTSDEISYGRWKSKRIKADRPGLPDAVRDSYSEKGKGGRFYVVKKGDSLAAISRRFYGDSKFWKSIHKANRRAIANPNALEPGVSLRIP